MDFTRPDSVAVMAETVDLVDGAPSELHAQDLAPGESAAGQIDFKIRCTDGTDIQAYSNRLTWQAVNKAGVLSGEVVANSLARPSPALSDPASNLTVTGAITFGAGSLSVTLTASSTLDATGEDGEFVVSFERHLTD